MLLPLLLPLLVSVVNVHRCRRRRRHAPFGSDAAAAAAAAAIVLARQWSHRSAFGPLVPAHPSVTQHTNKHTHAMNLHQRSPLTSRHHAARKYLAARPSTSVIVGRAFAAASLSLSLTHRHVMRAAAAAAAGTPRFASFPFAPPPHHLQKVAYLNHPTRTEPHSSSLYRPRDAHPIRRIRFSDSHSVWTGYGAHK